jgi:predicted patatin/cPLA2 family phospholipase
MRFVLIRNSKYVFSAKTPTSIRGIHSVSEQQILFANDDFLRDKKIISISPGGYKGIYMLGVCMFIKDNFNLDNYFYSGASAGAWNALTMCYKNDPKELKHSVLEYGLTHGKTLLGIQEIMKSRFLSTTKTEDFDLRRLFIGVTTINRLLPKTSIYYGFTNLEDALDCCIASSHIPFVTGGLTNKYRNEYTFDGGFSNYPYLNNMKPVIHISPSIWKEKPGYQGSSVFDITQYTTLFSRDKMDFDNLYESGYQDSQKNYDYLKYFLMD